ncbi:MAG: hypothetical protein U0Q04_00490 [Microbacterium sp.]
MAAPTGVVAAGAADTVTTLLDEYGGVAVFGSNLRRWRREFSCSSA